MIPMLYEKIMTGICVILFIYEIKVGIDIMKEIKQRGMDIFC